MTDKEIILAEIESELSLIAKDDLYDEGRWNELNHLKLFINSLPEEPVSNPTPNERMGKERFAEACKAACCDRNYRSHYGHTETRDDYFVDGVQWADDHPIKQTDLYWADMSLQDKKNLIASLQKDIEEPVSEDLKEAADKYATEVYNKYLNDENTIKDKDGLEILTEAFTAGAQWQKEKDKNRV